ncbi:MAG: glutamyl-tRNA reductase [Deltaproteobacteria bacterium]|nr:glutamyl-tRNA reductase [Deltaproteobacteria bacterium]
MVISVIGLNHKSASVDMRGRFSAAVQEEAVRGLMREIEALEAVVLYTCNRFELYTVTEGEGGLRERHLAALEKMSGESLGELSYWYTDEEAIAHLFRVSSSLDSLVIGEAQINGQAKEALRMAQRWGTAGPLLTRLFNHSFSTAKEVRSETGIGKYQVSVASVAVQLANSIFEKLEEKELLLIGAGKMAEKALKHLVLRGVERILVVNRTRKNAQELANRFGGSAGDLGDLNRALETADIVLSAVSVKDGFLIHLDQMKRVLKERKNRPLFILDIAVPRSVDRSVGSLDNVYYYELDDLEEIANKHHALRSRERVKAEEIISEQTARYREWLSSLNMVSTINSFKDKLEQIRGDVLLRFMNRLSSVSKEDRELIEQMTATLINKIAHDPISYLKAVSSVRGPYPGSAVLQEMFGLEEIRKENHCRD